MMMMMSDKTRKLLAALTLFFFAVLTAVGAYVGIAASVHTVVP